MPQRLKRRSEIEAEEEPEPTRARRDAESDSVSEGEDDYNEAMGLEDATTNGPPPVDQMIKKLVRLALATEFNRQPLRRADISTKVLEPHNRMFKPVFQGAQKALQQTFGMKLVEQPSKEKVTLTQKRAALRAGAATSQGVTNTASSSKSWILTSTLPASLRTAAILPPTRNPSATAEAEYMGFYTLVVSLIYLSEGARLGEGKLERYLSRANAAEYAVAGEKTENILKRMEKHGYIIKVRDRDPGGEETVDWMLGPRGKVEIGEKGVAGLVKTVYGQRDAEMDALEDKLERSLGQGTFKRTTRRNGANDDDEAEGEAEAEAEGQGEGERRTNQEDHQEPPQPATRSSRRGGQARNSAAPPRQPPPARRRRSEFVDDAAEEDSEDDGEEEEEDEEDVEEDD